MIFADDAKKKSEYDKIKKSEHDAIYNHRLTEFTRGNNDKNAFMFVYVIEKSYSGAILWVNNHYFI